MGTTVQTITDTVSLLASADTWIEGKAIQQLIKTSELENIRWVAGMPDLHPGRGYPIGAAFFSEEKIYPALIGNDIGCGMSLWQTSLKTSKANPDRMAKKLTEIEQPLDSSWNEYIQRCKQHKNIRNDDFDHALGTIGGGNHFAEFQCLDTVYDEQTLQQLGLDKKQLQLLIHSGSRGFGQSILTKHVTEYSHQGLRTDTDAFQHYLNEHDEAVRWAELNRTLIARRFIEALRTDGKPVLDINHNLMVNRTIKGSSGWLHRKGATPSDQGYLIIPGSRGDYSYLVSPLTENNAAPSEEKHLYSLAHGAGRKWQRGGCADRLSHKYKREDLQKTKFGSLVICNNKELLYDEAPQAYKKCESIIADLVDAGLIRVIARLRPVLTFKTNGGC